MSRQATSEATSGQVPEPRRRYHFHLPGLLYTVVTVFLALGAFNSQNNLLFWALGLAFGGLIVSGVVSGSVLMGIQIRREPVAPAAVGESMRVRYLLANASRFVPAFALHIEEADEHVRRGPTPTWRWHIEQPKGLVLHVGPRERVSVVAEVTPERRGEVRFTAVRVWTTFPFGITKKSVTFFQEGTAVVRPRLLPVRTSLLESIRSRTNMGHEATSIAGMGEEFFGLREYVPGDPPRMLAWRPSARLNQLVVRTNTTPSPRKVWLVLRLEGAGEEMQERAISLVASLLSLAARQGNSVGLAVPGAGIVISPRNEPRHVERLLNELGCLDLAALNVSQRVERFPAAASHGGGCIVVHAGSLDPTWGSRRARHLSARSLESLLSSNEGEHEVGGVAVRATPGVGA